MKFIIKIMIIALLVFAMKLFWLGKAQAGGPWSDQYCDVEVTQIRVVDEQGKVLENKTEEKMVCKDGASDFLFAMGIAKSCEMYTWDMPVGEVVMTQRQIVCQKMDGTGYEIVQGYHSID